MVESAAGSQIIIKKDLKTIDHIEGGADAQVNQVNPKELDIAISKFD